MTLLLKEVYILQNNFSPTDFEKQGFSARINNLPNDNPKSSNSSDLGRLVFKRTITRISSFEKKLVARL